MDREYHNDPAAQTSYPSALTMIKKHAVWVVFAAFSIVFALGALTLLAEARVIDDFLGGTVRAIGDDNEYQRLAINLRYGVGYTQDMVLPLDMYRLGLATPLGQQLAQEYREQGSVTMLPVWNFYRAPGYPMLLSAIYTVFGDASFTARTLTVLLIWAVAMLTMLTGALWAGWRGVLAAGLVGVIFIFTNHIRSQSLDRVMSEVSTAFWLALFGLSFVRFQKTGRLFYLLVLAVLMVCLIYTRANLLMLLPLFILYFFATKVSWKRITIFSVIVLVPVAIWIAFASANVGTFVSFTTQGAHAFPQYNNIDVLEGVGPERLFQGEWNPGYYIDADGKVVDDYRFMPAPNDNGWALGLAFWRDNLLRLPELFFVKLRAGFWTKETMAGPYTAGLCFLFISIGFRPPRRNLRVLPNLGSRRTLKLQVFLSVSAIILMVFLGNSIYGLVLAIFTLIIVLALLRPYGDVIRLPIMSPIWFLILVASHFITTILYMGVRFHEPLDPLLCMFGIYGLIILLEFLLFRRRYTRIYP